jgi:hypothetical protein
VIRWLLASCTAPCVLFMISLSTPAPLALAGHYLRAR